MDVDELWVKYKKKGDKKSRDELIVHYMSLIKYVVSKMSKNLPTNVDRDDLESYGVFGLIDAIDKFEPERGFKFETYAMPRIKGAVYDEMRLADWVPRSVRARAKALQTASNLLETKLLRKPTPQEIADEMEIPLEKVYEMQAHSTIPMASLDEFVVGTEETLTLAETIPEKEDYQTYELSDTLGATLNKYSSLEDRESLVLGLYYYENLTLSKIGELLSITESRVCQIHTKAVTNLRESIGG